MSPFFHIWRIWNMAIRRRMTNPIAGGELTSCPSIRWGKTCKIAEEIRQWPLSLGPWLKKRAFDEQKSRYYFA